MAKALATQIEDNLDAQVQGVIVHADTPTVGHTRNRYIRVQFVDINFGNDESEVLATRYVTA